MKKILMFFVIALWMVRGVGYTQPDPDSSGIKTIPVAGSVYMLMGEGGNIGVSVGDDGVLMVDDKFARLADEIRAALEKLSKSKVKFLLNTHWHGDHTGSNEDFGKESIIIAHDNVRARLSTRQVIEIFNSVSEAKPKEGLPVITFNESISIYFNDEQIDMIHFAAGHTDGDSVIFFRGSHVVHLGDHFFNGFYPFIDLGSGGNVEGFMLNVEKLIEIIPEGDKIIPGHGPLADINDLKAFAGMLRETTGIVQKAMQEGKSLEDIKAKGFSKVLVRKWGHGFLNTDQWITIVYNSYQ
ncbi:MBL fold metallo-hydrolase [PVC group bacterium]|nr:MBL fold metallo-hydrolase [PVC group bacterium]